MLGSVADAEDVVQDAYLRWHGADHGEVHNLEAFLVRTVTRLCLDALKSARARRETYVGPWLPEPLVEAPGAEAERADEVTLSLMLALESLSPLERAAYLLHDVFAMPFEEVARAIERDPAACRQLASRARTHVRAKRPRYPVQPDQGRAIAEAFFAASQSGDVAALQRLLAADATLVTDGGGKAPAALNPIEGRARIARFFAGIARKLDGARARFRGFAVIDGLPGYLSVDPHGTLQATALLVEDGRIAAVYVTRNPDKLGHARRSFGDDCSAAAGLEA
jgi:RNA polymerase sigma-70 factor, ECF subfamily